MREVEKVWITYDNGTTRELKVGDKEQDYVVDEGLLYEYTVTKIEVE